MKNKFTITRTLIALVLSLTTFSSYGQDSIRISGQLLNNSRYAKVVVKQYGIGEFAIGTFPIDKETGTFKIIAPKEVLAGIYRLQYSQTENEYIDIIINGKEPEIDFSIDVNIPFKDRLPVFSKSAENIAWNSFKQELMYQNTLIVPQFEFLASYPTTQDKLYQLVQKNYYQQVANYSFYKDNFIKTTPYYWAKNMAQYENSFFSKPKDHFRLQQFELHENFWKDKPTTDALLINTPLYTQSILSFIQYYMNSDMGFTEEEAIEGYKKAVDTIMKQFDGNEKTKEFAIKYLQMGFKEIGNEKVLQYIDEHYKELIEQCQDDSDKASFEKRMAGYAALKPGTKAPEISFSKASKTVGLKDLTTEFTVVAFWASWCPNCEEQMPLLETFLSSHKNVTAVAISLDDDANAYQTAIQKYPSMLHSCDFKKWDTKAAQDYFIYGSPTFMVLDKDHKIIDKVISANAVIELLEKK